MTSVAERKGSNWRAAQAVFWSFFGVRKRTDYEKDAVHLTPVQVVVIGLISAVLFVLSILGVVLLVTG